MMLLSSRLALPKNANYNKTKLSPQYSSGGSLSQRFPYYCICGYQKGKKEEVLYYSSVEAVVDLGLKDEEEGKASEHSVPAAKNG